MHYGDRIINGILSLICLEPCHSPTVPLAWEGAYRALADLAGTHSRVSIVLFMAVNNETVPDCCFFNYRPGLSRSVLPFRSSSSGGVFMGICVCWSQQVETIGTRLVKDDVSVLFSFISNFLNLGMCAEPSNQTQAQRNH